MLNDSLRPLKAETLAALRDYYREMAGQCGDLEEIKSRRAERRAYYLRKAALLNAAARVHLRTRATPEAHAIAEIAAELELPRAAIAANVAHLKRLAEAASRFQRDREIMTLARAGYRNAEIAAKVGLHPGSISRIIQSQLRPKPHGGRHHADYGRRDETAPPTAPSNRAGEHRHDDNGQHHADDPHHGFEKPDDEGGKPHKIRPSAGPHHAEAALAPCPPARRSGPGARRAPRPPRRHA